MKTGQTKDQTDEERPGWSIVTTYNRTDGQRHQRKEQQGAREDVMTAACKTNSNSFNLEQQATTIQRERERHVLQRTTCRQGEDDQINKRIPPPSRTASTRGNCESGEGWTFPGPLTRGAYGQGRKSCFPLLVPAKCFIPFVSQCGRCESNN